LGHLRGCLGGRPLGNPLNRLRIGLLGHRRGRLCGCLAGRPYGRLRRRLVGHHLNHPDDDLWDDLLGNPWDELRNRDTNRSSRLGSRAGTWAVRKAVGRSMARASARFQVSPLGCSRAGPSTCSCLRSSVGFAHGVVPRPSDNSPDRSLAMSVDVSVDRALVCFRSRALSGCGSSRNTGGLTRGGRGPGS